MGVSYTNLDPNQNSDQMTIEDPIDILFKKIGKMGKKLE